MASAMDGAGAGAGDGSGGGGDVNLSPLLRTLAKGAAITLGGIFSITMISSTAITLFTQHKKDKIGSSSSISMKKKNGSCSCDVCREKGFYICKLCNGNGTIEWSPLYDPLFINPCLCPTYDGHRMIKSSYNVVRSPSSSPPATSSSPPSPARPHYSSSFKFSAMDDAGVGTDDGSGGGDVNLSPLLRTLAKGAAITLGGIFSITMISSTAITLFTQHKKDKIGSSLSMKKKNGSSCDICREKGFYICKLCNGNGTIEWSPLYDPLFINPCLCPTCDGHRIQRCLNCLGSGYIQQAKCTK